MVTNLRAISIITSRADLPEVLHIVVSNPNQPRGPPHYPILLTEVASVPLDFDWCKIYISCVLEKNLLVLFSPFLVWHDFCSIKVNNLKFRYNVLFFFLIFSGPGGPGIWRKLVSYNESIVHVLILLILAIYVRRPILTACIGLSPKLFKVALAGGVKWTDFDDILHEGSLCPQTSKTLMEMRWLA